MKERFLMIPAFSGETVEGQHRLNELEAQAARLTEILNELRREGWRCINTFILVSEARKRYPAETINLDPSAFLFTGRRVVPDEKKFFEWYAGTDEGRQLRENLEAQAPGLFGRFARIDY